MVREQLLTWFTPRDLLPEKSFQLVFRNDVSSFLSIGVFDGEEFYDFEYSWPLDSVTEWAYI